MKIIQSFAQFEEGNPYLIEMKMKNKDYLFLNFYSFLLSYITLQRFYGGITMFCNQKAYDSIIKYIPYDEIVLKENDNHFLAWNKYKVDVERLIGDDFIHVDSDVFIFKDFFRNFIEGDYDILVQDIASHKQNLVKDFVFQNKEFLADTKILTKPYDGRAVSCGTVGLKKNVQEYYFAGADVLYVAMQEIGFENLNIPIVIYEELLLYLIAYENDFKIYDIVPQKLVEKYGIMYGGDKIGYVHVWRENKFKRDIINQIRKKIFFDFPHYYDIILKYEHEVLSGFKFFKYFNFPLTYELF